MASNSGTKWVFPHAAVLEYADTLERLTKTALEVRADEVEPYHPPPNEGEDESKLDEIAVALLFLGWGYSTGAPMDLLAAATPYPQAMLNAAKQIEHFNAEEWRRLQRARYGATYLVPETWLPATLHQWFIDNMRLIRSIPIQLADAIADATLKAATEAKPGQPPAKSHDEIVAEQKQHAITRSGVIGQDQGGKLNGQLAVARQKGIGATHYVWHGVLDARERDSHIARENLIYSFAEGSEIGTHPGDEVNCRCWGIPVWPAAPTGTIQPIA